jgi:hypothetical protein
MKAEEPSAERLRELRDKLCSLLEDSSLYDAATVLQAVAGTELRDEQVVLHSKVRPHLLTTVPPVTVGTFSSRNGACILM